VKPFPAQVLVVDDEPSIVMMFKSLLAARQLPCETASTAEQALILLAERPFGLLITDKNLPAMHGIDLIRRAKELQPQLQAMVITGYASTQAAVDAMRAGAIDFLEKPFRDLQLLAEKIEQGLKTGRVVHERAQLEKSARAIGERARAMIRLIDAARSGGEDPAAALDELKRELEIHAAFIQQLAGGEG
jgi:DNA-binding NtrC family response regulator